MAILVTGAAGFIGFHVAQALVGREEQVIGVDDLNDYYAPQLKRDRLDLLKPLKGFSFHHADIADAAFLDEIAARSEIKTVVHLAAQAGVRYSLENPFAYARSNLLGHLSILEMCRRLPSLQHLVYASSSSVYGTTTQTPFREDARADAPVSLYAATKRADELMSAAYADLYDLPQTGLRFFTVYGAWGRPDMAYWSFTEAILKGRPVQIFNNGDMRRDFSYIDDVVAGVLGVIDHPPADSEGAGHDPHRILNIGANRPEPLMRFIAVLEEATGREAEKVFLPMQPGDVYETYADTTAIEALCSFSASTPIEEGLPLFVDWFRSYHDL
ncbi:MAG: NAD-dependent epimerase/dehydratase family protein [Pseudomonadota bacterium]